MSSAERFCINCPEPCDDDMDFCSAKCADEWFRKNNEKRLGAK